MLATYLVNIKINLKHIYLVRGAIISWFLAELTIKCSYYNHSFNLSSIVEQYEHVISVFESISF